MIIVYTSLVPSLHKNGEGSGEKGCTTVSLRNAVIGVLVCTE